MQIQPKFAKPAKAVPFRSKWAAVDSEWVRSLGTLKSPFSWTDSLLGMRTIRKLLRIMRFNVVRLPSTFAKPWMKSNREVMLLPAYEHELQPVRAIDFKHLDLAFYQNHQRRLEQKRFRHISDLEDVGVGGARNARRTFLRFMVDEGETILANVYHFMPSWIGRVKGDRGSKVVEFETQFSDGSWICTSNAESAGGLPLPMEIEALYLAASSTLEELLHMHAVRIEQHLAARCGLQGVQVKTCEDVIRSQQQQQAIKALFRSNPLLYRKQIDANRCGANSLLAERLAA